MRPIHFLNTRPRDKATLLSQALIARGVAVRELPLLEILPCDLSDDEKYYLENIRHYKVVVCVSPTAATQVKPYLIHYQQLTQTWLAVGESTQETLLQLNINAQKPTDFALEKSNEGMLQLPSIQSLMANDSVLILRGRGGRRLLKERLQAKSIQVDSVAFYKRECPQQLKAGFLAVQTWVQIVLISSGEAWQHWLSVCCSPTNYHYLVLGSRLAHMLSQENCEFTLIEDLTPQSIYNALKIF